MEHETAVTGSLRILSDYNEILLIIVCMQIINNYYYYSPFIHYYVIQYNDKCTHFIVCSIEGVSTLVRLLLIEITQTHTQYLSERGRKGLFRSIYR